MGLAEQWHRRAANSGEGRPSHPPHPRLQAAAREDGAAASQDRNLNPGPGRVEGRSGAVQSRSSDSSQLCQCRPFTCKAGVTVRGSTPPPPAAALPGLASFESSGALCEAAAWLLQAPGGQSPGSSQCNGLYFPSPSPLILQVQSLHVCMAGSQATVGQGNPLVTTILCVYVSSSREKK